MKILTWLKKMKKMLTFGRQTGFVAFLRRLTKRGVLNDYPGTDDGDALRRWLQTFVNLPELIADMTASRVDDRLLRFVRGVLKNDEIWKVVFGLIQTPTAEEKETVQVRLGFQSESPTACLEAIGLILLTIDYCESRKGVVNAAA